jgi:hypothetical protein
MRRHLLTATANIFPNAFPAGFAPREPRLSLCMQNIFGRRKEGSDIISLLWGDNGDGVSTDSVQGGVENKSATLLRFASPASGDILSAPLFP